MKKVDTLEQNSGTVALPQFSAFQNVSLDLTSSGTVQYRTDGRRVHLRFINYIKPTIGFDSLPSVIAPEPGNPEGSYFLHFDSELTVDLIKVFLGGGIINPQATTSLDTINITADFYYFI